MGTEKTKTPNPPIYKVVHVEEDGTFSSIWTGYCTEPNPLSPYYHNHPCRYKLGASTKADPRCESQLIYCFRSLRGARKAYTEFGGYLSKPGPWAILKCEALSPAIHYHNRSDECWVLEVLPTEIVETRRGRKGVRAEPQPQKGKKALERLEDKEDGN